MTVFYEKSLNSGHHFLDEAESRHCIQVLRHKVGDEIQVVDGNGTLAYAVITEITKKHCHFSVSSLKSFPRKKFSIHLGIVPTKNMERIEWMIEKLSEIEVDEVTFLESTNADRTRLRLDRLEKKVIGALKQSKGKYLIKLNGLIRFEEFLKSRTEEKKLIAHLNADSHYISEKITKASSVCVVIGPEGDFSLEEVESATNAGFVPVSLGSKILRTETAGLLACHCVNQINMY